MTLCLGVVEKEDSTEQPELCCKFKENNEVTKFCGWQIVFVHDNPV